MELTIPAYLPSLTEGQKDEIDNLMSRFGNARRRAYNMQNKGVPESKGRRIIQKETELNSRYVHHAWREVETLPELVTFGGLENQRLMEEEEISVEEWHRRRNSILISEGDKANRGNVNLRVIGEEELKLRINVDNYEWIYPTLHIPRKYLEEYGHLLDGSKPYQVLIKRKNDGRYEVKITVHPSGKIEKRDRVMAIDLNSGFLDYSVVEKESKRLIEIDRIGFHEILDSGKDKTDNLIHEAVNKVRRIAEHYGAEVICGKFNTGNFRSASSQATRRIKGMSQYKFRKILKYKLNLGGLPVKFRSEAYTSIVGEKLGCMFGLDIHKGSAYAFALKIIDYHFFTFLRGVLTDDGGGSLGERLSEGSELTALVKSYASGNGNLVGLATLSLEKTLEEPPPCEGTTPRDLVGVAPSSSSPSFTTEVKV